MKFSHINTREIHPAYQAVSLSGPARLPYKQALRYMTVYIVKIKIHENITEEFSYVEPKSYDMPGKNVVCPQN
jgi:hypothetical protein